jgi:hypothetical protein
MPRGNNKLIVKKYTADEEQRLKDEEFLQLDPRERLRIKKYSASASGERNKQAEIKGS